MDPNEINDAMDSLGARYDLLASHDSADSRQIQAALSDWQDFYWGELDQWPVNDVARWEQELGQLQAILGRLEAGVGTVDEPVVSEPSGPIVRAPELLVTATWPTWMKVAAGTVLALGLYKVARKLEWL